MEVQKIKKEIIKKINNENDYEILKIINNILKGINRKKTR